MSSNPRALVSVFHSFANAAQTSYILSPDRSLLRCNTAWDEFARANGGDAVLAQAVRGSSLLDAISPSLRPFYAAGFDHACRTGERWEHVYECSSAEVHRTFRMIAYPFGDSLVVTHVLQVERPHDREASPPGEVYLRDGVIEMCAHCRLVRHATATRWDWVPALVAAMPPNVSHGLCPPCAAYYYPIDANT